MVRDAGVQLADLKLVDPGGAKFELDAALQGYGLHVSPEVTVRKHLKSGDLKTASFEHDWIACYYAIYRKGRVSNQVRTFLDWLSSICDQSQQ